MNGYRNGLFLRFLGWKINCNVSFQLLQLDRFSLGKHLWTPVDSCCQANMLNGLLLSVRLLGGLHI